ncbi:Histone-lysine N-methyltransferase SETMAR, partial [Habropoda laboriosa]
RAKLKDVRWEVLPHPPYSPYLPVITIILPMSNFLANRNLKNGVEVQTAINSFFESKTQESHKKEMYKLVELRVVELNGDYFIE